MTKTQIEALAAAFKRGMPRHHQILREGYVYAVQDAADVLERTRTGFDRPRFLKDSGATS